MVNPLKTPRTSYLVLGILALIIFVSGVIYWMGHQFKESLAWSDHSREVLLKLNKVSAMLETAETSQRGYVLTELPEFLKPYYDVEAQIFPSIEDLEDLVSDNEIQRQRILNIKSLAENKIERINLIIQQTEKGQKNQVVDAIREGTGQTIMTNFREAIKDFEKAETELLNQRFKITNDHFTRVIIFTIVCLLSAFAFGLSVISLLQKEILAKQVVQNELEIARAKALEISDLKTKFLANMSHEIRTPLNGIIGMTQMVLKTRLDSDQKGFIEVVRDASQSLLVLINEILDLSKIESGKLEIEDVNFELRSLIQSSISILNFSAQSKGVNIHVTFDPTLPDHYSGDSLRIRQVLINLLSNAIKFSDNTPVELRIIQVSRLDNVARVRFEVEDKGIGIEEAVQQKLFSQFTQGDQSTTRKYGGTGLGLSISKQLVELMGGSIGLKSQKSVGSTFHFEIPLRITIIENKEANETSSGLVENQFQGHTVLVAEDNLINQKVISAMLKESGCNSIIVENGVEALETLKKHKISLVIMDGHMPVMDGYEATRKIRNGEAGEQNSAIPIIAATANAVKGDLEKCLDSGMNDYLPKPLLLQDLEIKLRKWLSQDGSFINKTVLSALKDLSPDGSNSLLNDVIAIFVSSVPESLNKMRRFNAERDFESLRKEAHHLKSSCGNVGATTMYDLCYRLEKIKVTDGEQIHLLLEVMEKSFQMTTKELQRYASN